MEWKNVNFTSLVKVENDLHTSKGLQLQKKRHIFNSGFNVSIDILT